MLVLADGLIGMALSFMQLFWVRPGYAFVMAFLAGLTVLTGDALFFFDEKARWRLGICTACMAVLPEFCCFLPVFACKAGEKKQGYFLVLGILLSGIHAARGAFPIEGVCLALVSAGVGWYSARKTARIGEFREELLSSIDSSRERSLLMEEKNKALREKQDYEIYTATLRERNRIAREIHDNVGHLLSRSILLAGAMKIINGDPGLEEPLSNLEKSLNTAMTSIRSSVHDLHDDAVDLETASKELIGGFSFCKIGFQYDMGRSIPREIKYCFLAVLKEALNNVMKHSNATLVEVRMREQPGLYQLVIRDNGSVSAPEGPGIGLSNMAQRVQELEGFLHIHREKGFEIYITIPKRCEV